MKKLELIQKLQEIEGDWEIISEDAEMGYFKISDISLIDISKYIASDLAYAFLKDANKKYDYTNIQDMEEYIMSLKKAILI